MRMNWKLLVAILSIAAPACALDVIDSGFETSSMSPFNVQSCCGNGVSVVDWGEQARAGSKVAKFEWWADNYRNNRTSRGIEATSEDHIRIKKEGWYGFSFWVNAEGDNKFRLDSDIGIAQALANGGTATPSRPDCFVSWTWLLNARANGLHLSHRYGGGASTEVYLTDEIPTGRWVDMIFHMKWSQKNEGMIEVWVDEDCWGEKGEPTYAVYDIPFGLDCWEDDALVSGTHLKFGMYCHDTGAYVDGEKRVIYFDQIAIIDGYPQDAWYLVQPERSEGTRVPGPAQELFSVARNGYVELDWNNNVDADLAGYRVYRSEAEGGPYDLLNSALVEESSYFDNRLKTGTTYYYVVTAVDTDGNESIVSNETTVTPTFGMWKSVDVGPVALFGSIEDLGASVAVEGGGLDSNEGTVDSLRYSYLAVSGDSEILARISAIDSESNFAFAGVMLRESLDPDAKMAFVEASPVGDVRFGSRLAAGAVKTSEGSDSVDAPYWARIVRSGDLVTGYWSSDGVTWTEIGSQQIEMQAEVLVGLAISSGESSSVARVTFDDVAVVGAVDPEGLVHQEAEYYSATSGASVVASSEGGLNIVLDRPGEWVRFDDIDFGTGSAFLQFRVANGGEAGAIDILTSRSADSKIGRLEIENTGGDQSWLTQSILVTGLNGVKDLYFVYVGEEGSSVGMNWFEFTYSDETDYDLLDVWRYENFGTFYSVGLAADDADVEKDGRPNLLEYALGSNPFEWDEGPAVTYAFEPDDSVLRIAFDRIEDPDLAYQVEALDSLVEGNWISIWESIGASNVDGSVTIEDVKEKLDSDQRFLRLKVSHE